MHILNNVIILVSSIAVNVDTGFSRAVAQRCPEPPMLNLVSFGGQHQGERSSLAPADQPMPNHPIASNFGFGIIHFAII